MPTSQTIDVYREWLKIADANRPLNHYQLLKLKLFEDDAARIREHYRKLNEHVRKYASGQYGDESQKLLNELAK
ncbi:MAG: general secretion pathway protein GspE, partial [Planctomycetia bacterium]|nr:general secretion pathway protein GspE [Planctomycetia bacterium]